MTAEEFRACFPVFEQRLYMDIAARAPLSRPVREAYDKWLDDWQRTGGTKDQWMAALEVTRERFARLDAFVERAIADGFVEAQS